MDSNTIVSETTPQIDNILPFTEIPSLQQYDDHHKADKESRASDLFSIFTAEIIQADVEFTR